LFPALARPFVRQILGNLKPPAIRTVDALICDALCKIEKYAEAQQNIEASSRSVKPKT
jgi:hypothetical protein